jgi:predicted dienelactone hydrolase
MTWTAPAPGPADGPVTGDERPILEGYLNFQRITLLNICAGLTGEQLAEPSTPPSTLTLLGLIRHLAKVERTWFRQRAAAEPVSPLFDPELPKDTDFHDLDASRAEHEYEQLLEEIQHAESAAAGVDLDDTFVSRGETYSLRYVFIHMIAEYARHNGHADLLRERIDGRTGR